MDTKSKLYKTAMHIGNIWMFSDNGNPRYTKILRNVL